MVASHQGVVVVCQASEGESLEVPSRLSEGLEHMTPLTVQGGQAISEKCSIEPPPHYFQQLTFPFQRLCFPSTRGHVSRFLRISTMITVT